MRSVKHCHAYFPWQIGKTLTTCLKCNEPKLLSVSMLTHSNRSIGARVELRVASIVAVSDHSKNPLQKSLDDTHELWKEHLRQPVESRPQEFAINRPLSNLQQPDVLPLHVGELRQVADAVFEGRRGLEVRVFWRPPWACGALCHCACHKSMHGRTPDRLDTFLGVLFWGYCGLPVMRKECDINECRRQRGLRFGMFYYFPARFVKKKVELAFGSMPLGRPQSSMTFASIVSNDALLFKWTHNQDLQGIQSLFSQGLAAPSDVGHLDGCTALHVSIHYIICTATISNQVSVCCRTWERGNYRFPYSSWC